MIRKRITFFYLLLLFAVVISHPTDVLDGSGSSDDPEFGITSNEDETQDQRRLEALAKLQQIFGIPEPSDRPRSPHKIAPQFMMELYNTIADPSGVTRGKNPYNAKIVRSFIERDGSMSQYYKFNISGLEANESVLEAELHLYRKRTPMKDMHPAVLSSPYYLIRVYQVLNEHQLDIPDLHRLLNVHYVGAHASGWQVFNVKQAVLSWMSGSPNLGLLVTASNLFGDDATVHFSRRNDYRHRKQPILVLFDDDGKNTPRGENIVPHYYKYGNDLEEDEEEELSTSHNGRKTELEDTVGSENYKSEREKLHGGDSTDGTKMAAKEEGDFYATGSSRRQRRGASSPRKKETGIVSRNGKIPEALTSMDIYERAMMREKLSRGKKVLVTSSETIKRRSRSVPNSESEILKLGPNSNSTNQNPSNATTITTEECTRHELYVDFEEIGWSEFIIAPKGYSAYHCKGHCNFPLSQGQHPTNHATVQSLVHTLRQGTDVNQPCCVPTKLLSISLLYFLDDSTVVMKLYEDMVADRCGCH